MTVSAPFEELRNARGERLDVAWMPATAETRDVLVLGHGVTSHHDRPWLVAVGAACAARGICALRVSFAGNGASQGRFEDATISKEVEDLGAVVGALDGWRVGYAGHSMGAAVGVLRAAMDPRIEALVSLAGMVHVRSFMTRVFGELVPGRDVMLGKPHCPLTQTFLDDANAVDSVTSAAEKVRQPWLLVHGDADELVPLQDAIDAQRMARAAHLQLMPGADHRFTGCEAALGEIVATWLAGTWGGSEGV